MKRVLMICFLFMLQLGAESQSTLIDSFRQAVAVAKEDTNKVKQLNRLAELDEFTDADTALLLAEQADALANTLHYPSGMAFANLLLSGA